MLRREPQARPFDPAIDLVRDCRARWLRLYIGAAREGFSWKPVLAGLVIGIALSSLVLVRAVLANDGYLSPDSMNYLALANNLNQGHGLNIANTGRLPAGPAYFATWPVGYPFVIHLVSQLFGLSLFLASKIGNAIILLLSAVMLAKAFGHNGPVIALTLAFAPCLEIFSYTWSEVPFVFLLLSAAILLAGLIVKGGERGAVRPFILAGCCLGLFLSRYVGAFAISLIGIAALLAALRRAFAIALLDVILLVAVSVLVWLYLRHNVALTGYGTGMPRVPPTDSLSARFAMLARALWSEALLPIVEFDPSDRLAWLIALVQFGGLAALAIRVRSHYRHPLRAIRVDDLAIAFFIVASLYLAAIITLRWLNQFDPYNFRLLGPGTLLINVAILRVALVSWPAATRAITTFTAAMAIVSLGLAITQIALLPGPNYFATVRSVEKRYTDLPAGAIVVFGNAHLRYLRTDLFITSPWCRPWFDSDESWSDFYHAIDRRHPIFVDMTGPALDAAGCQPSVRAFLARHRPGELFQLTAP